MNDVEIRQLVATALADIAPEACLASISAQADLRHALDLDSMDFLNLVIALSSATGVDIKESDYPRLYTLAGMQVYFAI